MRLDLTWETESCRALLGLTAASKAHKIRGMISNELDGKGIR
jgi:hypothetical protein